MGRRWVPGPCQPSRRLSGDYFLTAATFSVLAGITNGPRTTAGQRVENQFAVTTVPKEVCG